MTARRELFEETGFTTEGALSDGNRVRTFVIDPRWRSRYASGITENVEHEWRYSLAGVVDVRVDKTEHSAYRWVSIDAAIDMVWSWTNKEALKTLQSELRQARQPV